MTRWPTQEPTPVVIIGFGRMGRLHARTLAAMPEFQVVAVVDTDADCASQAAAMGFDFFRRLDDLTVRPRLAVIAVPSSLHARVFQDAASRGMDCLVEKPVGMDVQELQAMSAFADSVGVRLFAGYSERFNPAMSAIIDAVRAGPCTISIRRLSAIALDRDIDGDVCHDLLVHDIDWLMCAVGARPVRMTAHDQRFHRGRVEHIACELEFPGDIHVHLEASRISARRERSVVVIGHAGLQEIFQLDAPRAPSGDDPLTAQARALGAALRRQPSRIADIHDALNVQHLLGQLKRSLSPASGPVAVLNAG